MKLCIIEDNDAFRDTLAHVLTGHEFEVSTASDGVELDQLLRKLSFDAYIIDLNLPGEDGLSIASRLKRAYPDCFIVMITARDHLSDRTLGYDTGADIYMTKPVDVHELIAALKNIKRRWSQMSSSGTSTELVLRIGDLTLHSADGLQVVALTPTQALILRALAEAPQQQLEYWQLLEWLDKPMSDAAKKILEVHCAHLRRKLMAVGSAPPGIRAVRKVGYALLTPVTLSQR